MMSLLKFVLQFIIVLVESGIYTIRLLVLQPNLGFLFYIELHLEICFEDENISTFRTQDQRAWETAKLP